MSLIRRLELFLFSAVWLTCAWFHQGGGWNQNARFAEVRAIVEQGRFTIDDYLVYGASADSPVLKRTSISNGDVLINNRLRRLAWTDPNWNLTSVTGAMAVEPMTLVPLEEVTATGDVSFAGGHFYSNKPPGASFVAALSYAALFHAERWAGLDSDDWWVLTLNAWLTTVFSVGLASAIGTVLFFRLALDFASGEVVSALLATLAFAFGTLLLPFGTLLFDHNLTTAWLLACYYFLRSSRSLGAWPLVAAGFCGGWAIVTNYLCVGAVSLLGLYLLFTSRHRAAPILFGFGAVGPLFLLFIYNTVCFGSGLALTTDAQNPIFQSGAALMGVFGIPRWDAAITLLVSPFRGLFFSAPVLILGLAGLRHMFRSAAHRADAWVFAGIALFFYLVNMSFNGYHAGYACGPRYLIPAVPFLALPLVFSLSVWPRWGGSLAAIAVSIQALFTITDPQSTVGVGGLAILDGRADWKYSPLTDYAAPLFFAERAWPAIELVLDDYSRKPRVHATSRRDEQGASEEQADLLRREVRAAVLNQEVAPLLLGSVAGPVSANPVGVYEGEYHHLFGPDDTRTSWNSFNLGEFFFPQSRWSIVPLLVILAGFAAATAASLNSDRAPS